MTFVCSVRHYGWRGENSLYWAISTVLCKSNKSELRRISLIVLANFRRNIGDISCELLHRSRDNSTKVRRNFARPLENSQSETKYRRSEFFNSRKFEEISLKRNEISANFPAVKARSRGFRDSLQRFHLLHSKTFIHEQKSVIK